MPRTDVFTSAAAFVGMVIFVRVVSTVIVLSAAGKEAATIAGDARPKKRGQAEWQNGRVQRMIDLDALIESGLPTSLQEAKKSGSKYYFIGNPCRNGHLSPRYMDGQCIQCSRDWKRRNADKRKAKYREKVDRELKARSGTPISQG